MAMVRVLSKNASVHESRAEAQAAAAATAAEEDEHGAHFSSHHGPFSFAALSSASHPNFYLLSLIGVLFFGLLLLVHYFFISDLGAFKLSQPTQNKIVLPGRLEHRKYLYWGHRIDCPGKHCHTCEGLAHQESSLRCALEEALFLNRTFVLPSRMCINQLHNDKSLLHASSKGELLQSWGTSSCSMESLYDLDAISETVRVVLDTSSEWESIISIAQHQLGAVIQVEGVSRVELKDGSLYQEAVIINRTANRLSWFMECKDRKNHSAVLLSYSFLPSMVAKPLKNAAGQIKMLLGDYDAIHVRRGDKLTIRKDRFGVNRTLRPHLDRDTQPHAIMRRIANWIPEGRTLFIASNERQPGFFDPLSSKYNVTYSSNFVTILDSVVQNNYQLFMVERLVLTGAKTFVKTFKEEPFELSLTDDAKKKFKTWQIPVYTFDGSPAPIL